MTELYDQDTPDEEDFAVCALQPVMRTATERQTGDEYPYCVVQRVAGADEPDCGTDDAVIQCDFYAIGAPAAKRASQDGHRRWMYIARNIVDITMSDGRVANADYVETFQKPVRLPFGDGQVVRYSGRYRLGLSYVAV